MHDVIFIFHPHDFTNSWSLTETSSKYITDTQVIRLNLHLFAIKDEQQIDLKCIYECYCK